MTSPIGAIRPPGIDNILARITEIGSGTFAAPGGPTAAGSRAGVPGISAVGDTAAFATTLDGLLGANSGGASGIDGVGQPSFSQLLSRIQNTTQAGTGNVDGALNWADTQIGTPYASVNPYRFGDVAWDGGAHLSVNGNGKTYQFPAGTKVYDCSGFATAVWRKAGIDLGSYGAATTEGMAANIPSVPFATAQKGDIVLIDSDGDGQMDHCQVLTGDGRAIHASGNGVQYTTPDWANAVSVVRPTLLNGTENTATSVGAQPAVTAGGADIQSAIAALLSASGN